MDLLENERLFESIIEGLLVHITKRNDYSVDHYNADQISVSKEGRKFLVELNELNISFIKWTFFEIVDGENVKISSGTFVTRLE